MSNNSKFILRTIRRHLTLIGLTYLITWLGLLYFAPQADPTIPVLLSLGAGSVYYFVALFHAPIPKSPVQQLMLNVFIFFYSLASILPLTLSIGFCILQGENPDRIMPSWFLYTTIYLAFALGFIFNRDTVAQMSASGRTINHWPAMIRLHKRRRS